MLDKFAPWWRDVATLSELNTHFPPLGYADSHLFMKKTLQHYSSKLLKGAMDSLTLIGQIFLNLVCCTFSSPPFVFSSM